MSPATTLLLRDKKHLATTPTQGVVVCLYFMPNVREVF